MAKVKLQYKTAEMVNPSTKEAYTDKRRPHIVNLRNYNIDELVKFALDNNYIEGAKYELAKGIVKGAIEAERALVLAGNSVSIDGWVKYEPRLKGSVAAKTRQLTKDNSLVMGISALKELRMSKDTFSWQLVDEGFKPEPEPTPEPEPEPADPPVATGYVADEMEGEPINVSSSTVVVSGTNLADATKVQFSYTEDGAAFYEADVTAATETSATVAMDYHQVPSSQHGYLRVVAPGGVSNALACSYAE